MHKPRSCGRGETYFYNQLATSEDELAASARIPVLLLAGGFGAKGLATK